MERTQQVMVVITAILSLLSGIAIGRMSLRQVIKRLRDQLSTSNAAMADFMEEMRGGK